MIEPGRRDTAGPMASDSDGAQPVQLAPAGGRRGIVDEFNGWLSMLVERNGSDLHLKVGTPPKIRESGALLPLEREHLSHDEMEAIGAAIVRPIGWNGSRPPARSTSPTRSPASDGSA